MRGGTALEENGYTEANLSGIRCDPDASAARSARNRARQEVRGGNASAHPLRSSRLGHRRGPGRNPIAALVMASAARRGDVVFTSDPSDLQALARYFPSVRVHSNGVG